ncbi:MAG TPA: hypothetical protein PLH19_10450 [Anaerolineae bacterium]|nr:hypothetical protein [Anaerolineae bacterium]HQH38937.1 hypothetical protein [Anaerolineae bacterium]
MSETLRRATRRRRRVLVVLVTVILAIVVMLIDQLGTLRPTTFSPTPTPQPTPTSWPISGRFDSPEYGINIHMWWDPWAALRRDWPLIHEAGFTWVKQRLAWQDVEGDGPGRYVWAGSDRLIQEAEKAEVNLIFRLDHPPAWAVPSEPDAHGRMLPVDVTAFGVFCQTMAERYKGRVRGYQVWNEPNLAREWNGQMPDPASYVDVLKTCYIGIKTADPAALVISAGLAPTGSGPPEAIPDVDYLIGMYEAGAAPYFDLLGLNAPGYKAPPEVSPDEAANPENGYGGHPVFCFRHVEAMRAIMEQYGDGATQVAILEFGWHTDNRPEHPDYAWFAVTPEQQADYLVRAFRYAREHWSPWIGPMFVWNLPDPHWSPDDEEFWWGIVDPFWWGCGDTDPDLWQGGAVRPAYTALAEMEKP